MEDGLIVNVADPAYDRTERRDTRLHPPLFRLKDGTAVFEVWFWHSELDRWFVMTNVSDPRLSALGVTYFLPGHARLAIAAC